MFTISWERFISVSSHGTVTSYRLKTRLHKMPKSQILFTAGNILGMNDEAALFLCLIIKSSYLLHKVQLPWHHNSSDLPKHITQVKYYFLKMSIGKLWIYCWDQIINQINPMWPDFTFYIWLWHWCTFICRRRSVTALILFDKNGCLAYNPQKNLTEQTKPIAININSKMCRVVRVDSEAYQMQT